MQAQTPATTETLSARSGTGILLVNLGSPDSPSPADVGRYLTQFLLDERVIDIPWAVRQLLVRLLIVPFRKGNSAHAYSTVWTPQGSPLVVTSRAVERALSARINTPVALGMRYGNPSIEQAVRELIEKGGTTLDEIHLIPLYPHYAMSSYETVVVETERVLSALKSNVILTVHPPFYNDPIYIKALVASARDHLEWDYDHILFSYHGIPERHVKKSDPTGAHCLTVPDCCNVACAAHLTCYRHQVFETTRLFVAEAGIPEGKYSIAFQSRLGRDPWLKPYTDFELERFPKEGIRRLLVICPAFVSDCLETIEEIGVRGKESFERAGGDELRLIPCMNEHPEWIQTLERWCGEA